MTDLRLGFGAPIACDYGSPAERLTTSPLTIDLHGEPSVVLTEVEDKAAAAVRPHIYVPVAPLAEWFLMNWWRLRWEARPDRPSYSWKRAHCLAAIGGDVPWPPLEITSDGDFIQLRMDAEPRSDVSSVRYLNSVQADIRAADFERAVDDFVARVADRLSAVLPDYADLRELRAELAEERARPSVSRELRWQALAGHNPGEVDDAWLQRARALRDQTGSAASDEVFGVFQEPGCDFSEAEGVLASLRASSTTVDVSWVEQASPPTDPGAELPWQTGARLANEMRSSLGLGTGPIPDSRLADLLSTSLPLQGELAERSPLAGGMRNGTGRTHIRVPSRRVQNQRFFLARVLGAAQILGADEHLLPVTTGKSSLQKLERSFAQELLCPWASLDAFTDEHGLSDDAIADAADHFGVSEWTTISALVNRGKLGRDRLPSQLRV